MKLTADTTRCTGNSGRPEDDFKLCPVRDTCARHIDYFAIHVPQNQPIPRMYAPDPCNLFIEDMAHEKELVE